MFFSEELKSVDRDYHPSSGLVKPFPTQEQENPEAQQSLRRKLAIRAETVPFSSHPEPNLTITGLGHCQDFLLLKQ